RDDLVTGVQTCALPISLGHAAHEHSRCPPLADLLVMGSHGKGWATRVLVGSVTERLLNHLPTSLVVVPVVAAEAVEPLGARLARSEERRVGKEWSGARA